jgi:hypothetical protein
MPGQHLDCIDYVQSAAKKLSNWERFLVESAVLLSRQAPCELIERHYLKPRCRGGGRPIHWCPCCRSICGTGCTASPIRP